MDYKKKYLNLKQIGGKFISVIRPQSYIDANFDRIKNKGTQNCGVFLNKKNKNQILICDKEKLPENKINFILQHPDIYPTLYAEIIVENKNNNNLNKNNNKYYYLWKKMDGDLRDLFTEIIPKEKLQNNYDFFYLKYENYPHNIYMVDDYDSNNKNKKNLELKNKFPEIYTQKIFFQNLNYREIKSNSPETIRPKSFFCREEDYKTIMNKLKSIEEFNTKEDYILEQIIGTIETIIEDMIIQLSKKMLCMLDNSFYYSDFKYDNIVYEIIDNNTYKFYFIDPESTLNSIEGSIQHDYDYEKIIRRINTKFNGLKLNDYKPIIYENFIDKMFNIIYFHNIFDYRIYPNKYSYNDYDIINFYLFNNKKKIECKIAQSSLSPDKNNIFRLKIHNQIELEKFLSNLKYII